MEPYAVFGVPALEIPTHVWLSSVRHMPCSSYDLMVFLPSSNRNKHGFPNDVTITKSSLYLTECQHHGRVCLSRGRLFELVCALHCGCVVDRSQTSARCDGSLRVSAVSLPGINNSLQKPFLSGHLSTTYQSSLLPDTYLIFLLWLEEYSFEAYLRLAVQLRSYVPIKKSQPHLTAHSERTQY
jgi:hypothetical protein